MASVSVIGVERKTPKVVLSFSHFLALVDAATMQRTAKTLQVLVMMAN